MARFAINDNSGLHAKSWAGNSVELPPITPEEEGVNLSLLEARLNREMKCFAGRNQVYLQSLILGGGTSRPRIALKCPLRGDLGLRKDVYYKFIRDICCGDPDRCEAARGFMASRGI